jgi:hypothetical protein
MDKTLEEKDEELTAAEIKIRQRLSFLKSYSNGLVPDPSAEIPIERRAELKKEKEEMETRMDELQRLLMEMRDN